MSKKLFISLAPVLAVAAFVVMPASALAAPHWTSGGAVIKEGKVVPTIGWGTLSLESAAGTITCLNSSIGFVENPVGGGAGKDATETFNPIKCSAPSCPAEIEVKAEGLPWPSELEEPEAGLIRDKFTGIKVRIRCHAGETNFLNTVFEGENKPQVKNGTSATKPGFDEFGAGSGELISTEVGPGKTTGKAKTLGYENQELIGTK